jgi:hypothetical protein
MNEPFIYSDEVLILCHKDRIKDNPILSGILNRAVSKFSSRHDEVVFAELADYIYGQLSWKKQCNYTWAIPILKMACDQVGDKDTFQHGCDSCLKLPKHHRDLHYAIFW